MKTKFALAAIASLLILSGCKGGQKKAQIIDQQPTQTASQSAVTTSVVQGLSITLDQYVRDEKNFVSIQLENTSDKEVMLNYENGELFKYQILDQNGAAVHEGLISDERKKIQPKEKLTWQDNFDFSNRHGSFDFAVELLLKDDAQVSYNKEELIKHLMFENTNTKLSFLPKTAQTYVYAGSDGEEGGGDTEQFQFFSDGYAQSYDSVAGTRIYYYDNTGLYLAYLNPQKEEQNIIGAAKIDKKLLLKLPAKTGDKWEVDGVQYEVVSTNATIRTPVKVFNDAVEVKADIGTETHYFYQADVGLVAVKVKDGDQLKTVSILNAVN